MRAGLKAAMRARRRAREGASAVEFALVALPFLLLLLGILEIGVMLLADSVVETAAADAARQVRTGQAQDSKMTADDFKKAFCERMSILSGDCPGRTFIDVGVIDGFPLDNPDRQPPDPMATGVFDPSELRFEPGLAGERVLVRIWYEHSIFTPFIAQAVSRGGDGRVMLTVTLAFRNEPYQ